MFLTGALVLKGQNIIYAVIFMVMGLLFVSKPDMFWEMMHSKDRNHAKEPTKGFVNTCKISGLLCMILGLILFFAPMISGQ